MKKQYLARSYRSYIKKFVILFLFTFSGWLLYFIFIESSIFKVGTIQVLGAASYVSERDLYEVVKTNAMAKNILFLNTHSLETLLTKNFEGAKSIYIEKSLPTTLKVNVSERVPLGIVYKPQTNEHYLIDDEGYILGYIEPEYSNLPTISYNGDIKIGSYLDATLVPNYILLMKELDDNDLKVSSLSFYPKYTEIYLNQGIQVLLSYEKNKPESVKLVKTLLMQLAEEKQNVSKIDLRYEKVIVSY